MFSLSLISKDFLKKENNYCFQYFSFIKQAILLTKFIKKGIKKYGTCIRIKYKVGILTINERIESSW